MQGIEDADMSIFDSPAPAVKRNAPPMPLTTTETTFAPWTSNKGDTMMKKKKLAFLDLDNDSSSPDDDTTTNTTSSVKETPATMTDKPAPAPAVQNYEELMKEAAKWTSSMNGIRDNLDTLRVEAAITLDKFAMLYDEDYQLEERRPSAKTSNNTEQSTTLASTN